MRLNYGIKCNYYRLLVENYSVMTRVFHLVDTFFRLVGHVADQAVVFSTTNSTGRGPKKRQERIYPEHLPHVPVVIFLCCLFILI